MKKLYFLIALFPLMTFAQDDLLAGLDSVPKNQSVESAFKALKIVNIESTKLAAKGDFYFVVAHRFNSIKTGFEGGYGLDNAVTQLKFLYGLTKWLTVSAARSEPAYDFSVKYKLMDQKTNGFPVAIVGFNSVTFNNALKESNYPNLKFEDRAIYVAQVLISRKCTDKLSLEVAPTFFHENFVDNNDQDNSQYAVGVGGRYKMTKRLSLNIDYAAHLNRANSSITKIRCR